MSQGGAILFEEHYIDSKFAEAFPILGGALVGDVFSHYEASIEKHRLARIVLSHAPCVAQNLPPVQAREWCERLNTALADRIAGRPAFGAFSLLPMSDPEAAARELERSVRELGFHGAMVHGLIDGVFPDAPRFAPVLATAERLGVPIYLHPGSPHPDVMRAYYAEFSDRHPMLAFAAAGFTCEMMVVAIRMILSGVSRRFPDLRLILGHHGEAIPYLMERIDETLARDNGGERFFRKDFLHTFRITTSAAFSDAAFRCAVAEMGLERIAFSVDEPFAKIETGLNWIDGLDLDADDRGRLLSGNARQWLSIAD